MIASQNCSYFFRHRIVLVQPLGLLFRNTLQQEYNIQGYNIYSNIRLQGTFCQLFYHMLFSNMAVSFSKWLSHCSLRTGSCSTRYCSPSTSQPNPSRQCPSHTETRHPSSKFRLRLYVRTSKKQGFGSAFFFADPDPGKNFHEDPGRGWG